MSTYKKCAFCRELIAKGVQSFGIPKDISPEAKKVWDSETAEYIEFRQNDRVCASHFSKEAKCGKRLTPKSVPTIGVNYKGPSILPQPTTPMRFPIKPPPRPATTPTMNSAIEMPKRQTLTMRNSPAKVTIKPIRPGQNPFQCNFCPDTYEKESTLNYHINDQHQKELAAAKVEILSIENIDNCKIPGNVTQDENANELVDYDTVEEVCEAADVEVSNEVVNDENELDEVAGQVVYEDVEYLDEEYEYGELDETTGKVEYALEDVNFEDELEAGDGENEPEELSDGGTSNGDVNAARMSAAADYRKKRCKTGRRIHGRTKTRCKHCEVEFTDMNNWEHHFAKFHPGPFKDSKLKLRCGSKIDGVKCGLEFDSHDEIVAHKIKHHEINCPVDGCTEKFGYKSDLVHHKNKYHKRNLKKRTVDEKVRKNCEAIDIEKLECIKRTKGKANKLLRKFYNEFLTINEYVPGHFMSGFFERMGVTQEEFDRIVSADPYYQEMADELEDQIEKRNVTKTKEEVKTTTVSRTGGSCNVNARINKLIGETYDEIVPMIYVDSTEPDIRNIYGECLYVKKKVDKEELQIAERMVRYILIQRGYNMKEDKSNIIQDHEQFMMRDGNEEHWVYVFFYDLKYINFMCRGRNSYKYVPFQLLRTVSNADEALTRVDKYQRKGQSQWKVPIDKHENSQRSKKQAEEIERDVRHHRTNGA